MSCRLHGNNVDQLPKNTTAEDLWHAECADEENICLTCVVNAPDEDFGA